MAIVARYHELRKEIEALVAENEELKQLVQLLRENQELRAALRHNESSLLPVFESSRINEQEPLVNHAFLDSSGWERSGFASSLRTGLRQRHPTELVAQAVQQLPPPSPPGGGAGAVALRHPTLRMALQQPPDVQQARRQAPPRYRGPPSGSAGSSQANDGFCPNYSSPDTIPNDSLQRSGPRGYCYECPIPWHPHLALFSPTTSGSGFGSGSSYMPDSSLASPLMGRTHTLDILSDLSFPSTQNLSELSSVFHSDSSPLNSRYLQPASGFSYPSDQSPSQPGPVFGFPSDSSPLSSRYLQPASAFSYPSDQNLSQLSSGSGLPCDVAPLSNRYLQPPPPLIFNFPSVRPYPSTQNLSQLPSVFGSPGLPFTQNLSQLTSVFGSPYEMTPLSNRYLQPASAFSYPSDQNLSQLSSGTCLPCDVAPLSNRYLQPPPRLIFNFPSVRSYPSTQNLSLLPSVFGSPGQPFTQNLSQLSSVFGSPYETTPLSNRYLQPASAFSYPSDQNFSQLSSGTFLPCDVAPLSNRYLQPPPRLIFNFPSVRPYPSTQNLSLLPSVFGSPGQPFTQNLSQLTSVFGSPYDMTPLSSRYLQPALTFSDSSDSSFPSTQNTSQLTSVFGYPPDLTPPSMQNTSQMTSVFGFPPDLTPPSTQNLSQLTSVFGFGSPQNVSFPMDSSAASAGFAAANNSGALLPWNCLLLQSPYASPSPASAGLGPGFNPPVLMQATFQPLMLQNPAPFVLQPPPLSRKARPLPPPVALQPAQSPLAQPGPAGLPPAVPLQAPTDPQRPPDVRPKERRGPIKQDAAAKTSDDAKAKDISKQERIVGEIAFQLDRRILSSIFPDRVRLYGFTVRNIPEKVTQTGKDPFLPLTPELSASILERYNNIMDRLKPLGYNASTHPRLTEHIVNTFGILRERPEATGPEATSYNDIQYLQDVVRNTAPPEMLSDCQLLLNCLHKLSQDDGKPLFIW